MSRRSDLPDIGGRNLAASLMAMLGQEWRCLADAVVSAAGEEGRVDLVALNPALGVVLVGFVEDGEEASPEGAVEALRDMLRETGFAERFPGHLGIVALTASPEAHLPLATAIRRAAAAAPPTTVSPGWIEWLAERLAPADRPALRLVAPLRDEPVPAALVAPLEAPPHPAETPPDRWAEWGVSLALAFGAVAALLLLLLLFSRNGIAL